ncbi:MAG: MarR family winged helix-turn-helix transcriptional regulator [Lautropia sp.]
MKRKPSNETGARGKRAGAPSSADATQGRLEEVLERLHRRPGFLLRRCMQHISGVFEQNCADLGLTARQYDYLFVLDVVGEIGQGEIGEMLGLDRSTNTLVLKILERKKWVAREVVESDVRRRVVRITMAGRDAFAQGRAAAETAVACISGSLTKSEYQTLITLLKRIMLANVNRPLARTEAISRRA